MTVPHHDLIVALVSESGTTAEYSNDPEFHSAVDLLAKMLPSMVKGLAADCVARAEKRSALIDHINRTAEPLSMGNARQRLGLSDA